MKEPASQTAVRNGPESRISARVVSRGIAIGKAVCLYGSNRQFFRVELSADKIDAELDRLDSAVRTAIEQLENMTFGGGSAVPDAVSDILDVQLLLIRESSLIASVREAIIAESVNAEWAVRLVADDYLNRYRGMKDEHLREKAVDLEDVVVRILNALAGDASVRNLPHNSIIVASEIRPSTLLEFVGNQPSALVSERGGWTSHVFIMARELGIPALAGISKVTRRIKTGELVGVDAISGEVFVRPKKSTISELSAQLLKISRSDLGNADCVGQVSTADGVKIRIAANVDKPEACKRAIEIGVNGIGLLRSEYLFDHLNGLPKEESQTAAYRKIAEIAGIAGVRIRTFDLGVEQTTVRADVREKNPALGLRAIRLSLTQERQFRIQIRAILRSAYNAQVSIVLPLVSGVEDIKRSLSIVKEEWIDLNKHEIPCGQPELGVMIELPSAVFSINEILRHVDFVCLGTNDLVQYLVGVDRDNESVAEWYQTLHPAVIKAVQFVLNAADEANIPAVVCGEMAGSPFYTPLLIGLGARDLSMNLHSIEAVRRLIGGISYGETLRLVEMVKTAETAPEIQFMLLGFYRERWPDLFPPEILDKCASREDINNSKK